MPVAVETLQQAVVGDGAPPPAAFPCQVPQLRSAQQERAGSPARLLSSVLRPARARRRCHGDGDGSGAERPPEGGKRAGAEAGTREARPPVRLGRGRKCELISWNQKSLMSKERSIY